MSVFIWYHRAGKTYRTDFSWMWGHFALASVHALLSKNQWHVWNICSLIPHWSTKQIYNIWFQLIPGQLLYVKKWLSMIGKENCIYIEFTRNAFLKVTFFHIKLTMDFCILFYIFSLLHLYYTSSLGLAMSDGQSTPVVQTEIFPQILDGFPFMFECHTICKSEISKPDSSLFFVLTR